MCIELLVVISMLMAFLVVLSCSLLKATAAPDAD